MPKGELIIKGRFRWFSEKNKLNVKKHGFSFEQILDVFDDPYFYEIYDKTHSGEKQDRYNGFGYVNNAGLVIQIVYTETGIIHIISARAATKQERRMYYDRLRKIYSEM